MTSLYQWFKETEPVAKKLESQDYEEYVTCMAAVQMVEEDGDVETFIKTIVALFLRKNFVAELIFEDLQRNRRDTQVTTPVLLSEIKR